MTETTMSTPLISPRLARPREAPFKGVCAALARTTGTGPVLWRVLVVVLTFFGGFGAVLYLAGVVVIPAEGEERSLGERLLRGPDRQLRGNQLLLIVLLVIGVVAVLGNRDGVLGVVVLGGLILLWFRSRTQPLPTQGTPAAPYDVAGTAATVAAPPVHVPRPRSPLVGVTASLAALTAGVLLLIGSSGGASIPAEVVLGATLGVVGLGLVLGSWWGRSGVLIALAVVLGLALAVTAAVRPAVEAGLGDRTWVPGGSGSYRLGVGEATLDLRALPVREAETTSVAARVDVGHLLVLLPAGVRTSLDARAQLGDLLLLGVDTNGREVSRHLDLGPPGRPQVRLDLSVRTGQVEVRRG